jgi:hypothetical protein
MSPSGSESAAVEISTAGREATPNAVETRSEFRYAEERGMGVPWGRKARWLISELATPVSYTGGTPVPPSFGAPRVVSRSGILKKFRPQPARPCHPPSKLVPSSASGLQWRGGAGVDLRMAVALWATGIIRFPCDAQGDG